MRIDVSTQVTIGRSRDDVAAYAMDPAHDPEWIGGIIEAEQETPPPIGVGTRVRRVASFLGRKMDYTPEVVEYEPGRKLVMTTDRPFDMTISYGFEDHAEGTRASIRIQGEGSGFYRVASPLLAPMVRRRVTKDLEALRDLLEA